MDILIHEWDLTCSKLFKPALIRFDPLSSAPYRSNSLQSASARFNPPQSALIWWIFWSTDETQPVPSCLKSLESVWIHINPLQSAPTHFFWLQLASIHFNWLRPGRTRAKLWPTGSLVDPLTVLVPHRFFLNDSFAFSMTLPSTWHFNNWRGNGQPIRIETEALNPIFFKMLINKLSGSFDYSVKRSHFPISNGSLCLQSRRCGSGVAEQLMSALLPQRQPTGVRIRRCHLRQRVRPPPPQLWPRFVPRSHPLHRFHCLNDDEPLAIHREWLTVRLVR